MVVILRPKLSSFQGRHPSKVVFHSGSFSIQGCLPCSSSIQLGHLQNLLLRTCISKLSSWPVLVFLSMVHKASMQNFNSHDDLITDYHRKKSVTVRCIHPHIRLALHADVPLCNFQDWCKVFCVVYICAVVFCVVYSFTECTQDTLLRSSVPHRLSSGQHSRVRQWYQHSSAVSAVIVSADGVNTWDTMMEDTEEVRYSVRVRRYSVRVERCSVRVVGCNVSWWDVVYGW